MMILFIWMCGLGEKLDGERNGDNKMKHIVFFNYVGGKNRTKIQDWIISNFPPHDVYVEVFGGSGGILLNKPPAGLSIYNDINSFLTHLFKIMASDKWEVIADKLENSLYSREIWNECARKCAENDFESEEDFGFSFLYVRLAGFGGKGGTFGYYKLPENIKNTFNKLKFEIIHGRLRDTIVENLSFDDLIPRYDSKKCLFYCDPPYLNVASKSSMKDNDYYVKYMLENDHKKMIEILCKIKGMAIISGYENETYKKLEDQGWTKKSLSIKCTLSSSPGPARITTENIWISPNSQIQKTKSFLF